MNVGYSNSMETLHKNPICPLCGSDVYGSKYGNDFTCVSKECVLNGVSASVLVKALKRTVEEL